MKEIESKETVKHNDQSLILEQTFLSLSHAMRGNRWVLTRSKNKDANSHYRHTEQNSKTHPQICCVGLLTDSLARKNNKCKSSNSTEYRGIAAALWLSFCYAL